MSVGQPYLANGILSHYFKNTAFAFVGTMYMGLFVGGVEVSAGSYARVAVTSSFGSAASGKISNTAAITFATAASDWGEITHYGIFDAASSGNLLLLVPFKTTRTVKLGSALRLDVGQAEISVSTALPAGVSVTVANAILNHALGKTQLSTPPAAVYVAFLTSPTTEVVGGSYGRTGLAYGTPSSGLIANTGTATRTATAAWGTITHIAIYDALTGGNQLFIMALPSPISVANADSVSIAAGALVMGFI